MFINPLEMSGNVFFSNEYMDMALIEPTSIDSVMLSFKDIGDKVPKLGEFDYIQSVRYPNVVCIVKNWEKLSELNKEKIDQITYEIPHRGELKFLHRTNLLNFFSNVTGFLFLRQTIDGLIWSHNSFLNKITEKVEIERNDKKIKISCQYKSNGSNSNGLSFINEFENIMLNQKQFSPEVSDKIVKRIQGRGLSNHYLVLPIDFQNNSQFIDEVSLKMNVIRQMTIENMLNFFEFGTRKGSKIDTLKNCLSELSIHMHENYRNIVGKKVYLQIRRNNDPMLTKTENLSQDFILALSSRLKILSTHDDSKNKSIYLVGEITEHNQDDLATRLYCELENNSIILTGFFMEDVKVCINRCKDVFLGKTSY